MIKKNLRNYNFWATVFTSGAELPARQGEYKPILCEG